MFRLHQNINLPSMIVFLRHSPRDLSRENSSPRGFPPSWPAHSCKAWPAVHSPFWCLVQSPALPGVSSQAHQVSEGPCALKARTTACGSLTAAGDRRAQEAKTLQSSCLEAETHSTGLARGGMGGKMAAAPFHPLHFLLASPGVASYP